MKIANPIAMMPALMFRGMTKVGCGSIQPKGINDPKGNMFLKAPLLTPQWHVFKSTTP